MDDIVPALLDQIETDLSDQLEKDRNIKSILERVSGGIANHADTGTYALRVGQASACALRKSITQDALPYGTPYYNIVSRTIGQTMDKSYRIVMDTAEKIQKILNEKAGLWINPVIPELDQDRLHRLINLISSEEIVENLDNLLDWPIINFVQSCADNFVQANMELHGKLGLTPTIHRAVVGETCDWCDALIGVYRYPDVPKQIFMRHRGCDCLVTYDPGDGARKYQNVHRKNQWIDADEVAALEARKTTSTEVTKLSPSRAAILERLLAQRIRDG